MKTNKEKDNKKLMIQKILERVQMDGWERGKKQCKTPYDFTLADETFLEEQFNQICQLIPEEGVVIAEGIYNYDNKDIPFWIDNTQVSMEEYKGKKIQIKVKIILEEE